MTSETALETMNRSARDLAGQSQAFGKQFAKVIRKYPLVATELALLVAAADACDDNAWHRLADILRDKGVLEPISQFEFDQSIVSQKLMFECMKDGGEWYNGRCVSKVLER